MKLNFFNQLIVRSAALPYGTDLNEQNLFTLWQNPLIREGIYLASQPLYEEIVKFVEMESKLGYHPVNIDSQAMRSDDNKEQNPSSGKAAGTIIRNSAEKNSAKNASTLLQSMYKYMARMSNRSTPFGVFSGVTALDWGTDTNIVLQQNFRRQVNPDAIVSLHLAEIVQQENPDSQYRINNTLYRQGDEYRFISYTVAKGERYYQLSSLKHNDVLAYLIEDMRHYALTCTQIIALSGYDADEFLPFLKQLIDIQFLKYAHQPGIGLEFPEFIKKATTLDHHEALGADKKMPNGSTTDNIEINTINPTILHDESKAEITQNDNVIHHVISPIVEEHGKSANHIEVDSAQNDDVIRDVISPTVWGHGKSANHAQHDSNTENATIKEDKTALLNVIVEQNKTDLLNLVIDKFENLNTFTLPQRAYIKAYQDIEKDLTNLLGYRPANTFHITRFNELESGMLSNSLQHKLDKAIRLLNNLNDYEPNPRVERFKKDFKNKYEERSVPLLEVFDTDIGIQYGKSYEKATLFTDGLEDISFGVASPRTYHPSDLKLLKVLTDACYHRQYTYTIADNFAEERNLDQLPHTMSATFQVFDGGQISLEQVSGTGAIGFLSRFASGSKAIHDLALEITKEESSSNPEAIYAEIIHLPEERSLNIMAHPPFWDYEIQYIDQANEQHVISLTDLEVLLVGNSFRLFSRKLQKEVIPRLSSAYNYSRSQHPIYTFLCDIQHQHGNNGLVFKWGELAREQVFFPRVITTSGVIVHRATWKFTQSSLADFNSGGKSFAQFKLMLSGFQSQWMLPASFLIVKGDNELLIDCSNEIALEVLFKEITKKPTELILKECLHREWDTVVKDQFSNSYGHQFVAPFSISNKISRSRIDPVSTSIKREFIPGSRWLYLKLFLAENTAQPVLLQLYTLLEKLSANLNGAKLIHKWFFIRYQEGGNHIRLRVDLLNALYFQQVYFAIMEVLETYISQKLISAVQLDTYIREIERYGPEKMEIAEELFAIDTRFCCKVFALLEQDYMNTDWLLIFWCLQDYLNRMDPDQTAQLKFAERQLTYFLNEFDDKAVKVQIDQLNRKYRGDIDQLASKYQDVLGTRKSEIDQLLSKEEIVWDDRFLGSIIHMLLNRYFNTNQRLHECLLYGFVVKALKTEIARSATRFQDKRKQ
jgi:thiopeptide-type bacteriocin biosynthesis protein